MMNLMYQILVLFRIAVLEYAYYIYLYNTVVIVIFGFTFQYALYAHRQGFLLEHGSSDHYGLLAKIVNTMNGAHVQRIKYRIPHTIIK